MFVFVYKSKNLKLVIYYIDVFNLILNVLMNQIYIFYSGCYNNY